MSKSIVRLFMGFLVLFLLLAVAPAGMMNAQTEDEEKEKQDCCFTNPKYAGVCGVDPAEGETCASILEYLNNPNSAGKTYCEATLIRVGWKQTACEKDDEDKDEEDQD